jgi:tartrate dehydratase beta subunit/fumarate hydratase class I family protein
MDFSAALRAVKSGGGAYRAGWREAGYDSVVRLVSAPFPLLVMTDADGDDVDVFACAQHDLLAEDWELTSPEAVPLPS